MALYRSRTFEPLLGMPGFSTPLLKAHFGLYEGYVSQASALQERLEVLLRAGKVETPEYAELKRRFGWEFNGMRLHELYFDTMSKKATGMPKDSPLGSRIAADFGSAGTWMKDFKATGSLRGVGWAALVWDPMARRLLNIWIHEHDGGHLTGCPILLLMDVFEHAYLADYGVKRADYIEAFFNVVAWDVVESRLGALLEVGTSKQSLVSGVK